MDSRHQTIAKIALAAAGDQSLALAGGYAVQAHGIGNRPSGDVDLFTDWHRKADFPRAVDAVISGLHEYGYSITVDVRGETFARLLVSSENSNSEPDKVELSADWRAHPPVMLEIGPVLHQDDAVANKMCALFNRALPRDFLDIDAAITSGRYSKERLLELAANADSGFDRNIFAAALAALTQITDDAFGQYNTPPDKINAMRKRFGIWQQELSKLIRTYEAIQPRDR